MITIKNASITYQTKETSALSILDNVSLTIPKGKWLSIVGPSGSGKTSFLKLIGGLLSPVSGSVVIDDNDLYNINEKQKQVLQRKKMGFVYQQFRLLPQFTVLENVMLPLIPYEKKTIIQEKAKEKIEKIGLTHRINHVPHELSGGEQQRVAFARALLTEPGILLCDEPTGNLDVYNRSNILKLLQSIHHEGHTIVLATHDEVVANKGEQIFELADGKLLEKVREE